MRRIGARKTDSKKAQEKIDDSDREGDMDDVADPKEGEPNRIKILALKCTVSGCDQMVRDYNALYGHLRTAHKRLPFQCLAQGCDAQFENK